MKALTIRRKTKSRRAKKPRHAKKTRRTKQRGGASAIYPDSTEVTTLKSNGDYGTPDDIPTLIGSNKIEPEETV
jgi:hypothetical protein